MDKQLLLYSIIELIVLCIPVVTLIFKYASWKKEVDLEIQHLKESDSKQDAYYTQICKQLTDITKVLVKLETKLEYIERKHLTKIEEDKG